MSAYIVGAKTINRIISLFEYALRPNTSYGMERAILNSSLFKEGYFNYLQFFQKYPVMKGMVKLGKRLYLMNEQAIKARYGEEEKGIYRKNHAENVQRHDGSLSNFVQPRKSIACYLYQCPEVDVPNQELFKELQNLCHAIDDDIVSLLPEYQNA